MLAVERRIELLSRLGEYMLSTDADWEKTLDRAVNANAWFTPADVSLAVDNIAHQYLQKEKLQQWVAQYRLPAEPKKVGIVMAGNIPLVGFHDFLCGFICGHRLLLKLSSKDEILLRQLLTKLVEWEPEVVNYVHLAEMLKGCDAYIATGSNNTARYFEQYFAKYKHIIRKNRTSVAVLDGTETDDELNKLADDVFTYFGLGCRNITQVCLPRGYDPAKLMDAFTPYKRLIDHNKYKNNYDYHLALYLLNKVPYLTNESVLMVENPLPFSAVSVLHYIFYDNKEEIMASLQNRDDIQSVVGHGAIPFGMAQKPALTDYADGVDTMAFLCNL